MALQSLGPFPVGAVFGKAAELQSFVLPCVLKCLKAPRLQ